nr:AAA family ATPase [Pediococcus pentosaceus]
MENLDLISSVTQFKNLPKLLMSKFPNNDEAQINYLNELLKPLKEKYDAIYIDVPPTISDFFRQCYDGSRLLYYCFTNSGTIFRWSTNIH